MSTGKISGDWSVRDLPANKYSKKCPHSMAPVGICLHNTANSASASAEISYMQNNTSSTSYHLAVDEKEAIQGLPLNRNGWHAGDGGSGSGNRKYIGIEIARSTDQTPGRFAMAEKRAAAVCANLLSRYGWGVNNIKPHRDFSGKNCPHRTNMASFKSLVTQALGGKLTDGGGGTPTQNTPAPTQGTTYTTTAAALNVRSGPGTSHRIVGSLSKGSKVLVVGTAAGGWLKINHNGSVAYISGKYAQKASGGSPAPAPAPAPTQGTTYQTTATALNVRSGPGTSYRVVGSLSKGSKVTVTGTAAGGWLKINHNGGVAYISGKYAQKVSGGAPAPAPAPTPTQGTTYTTTATALNVRSGPGTSHRVLGSLSKGTKVTVTGTATGGWLKINYQGKVAYISGKYAQKSSGSTPAPAPAPAPTQGTTYTTTADVLNVRKGPGTSYQKVGTLSRGSKVTVTGTAAGGWLKINFQGGVAYISGKYAQKGSGSSPTPPVNNAPRGGKPTAMSTRQVAGVESRRTVKKVVDLKTKQTFNVSWAASPGYHTDFTPMTSADTTVIKGLLNPGKVSDAAHWRKTSSWSWTGRPGSVQLSNGTWVACGFHLRPHAAIMGGNPGAPLTNKSNTRPAGGWAIGGHMCMYYGDSPGGTQDCNRAAKEARNMNL